MDVTNDIKRILERTGLRIRREAKQMADEVASQIDLRVSYVNPWYHPHHPMYGPPEYTTEARPVEYRGYLIYQRIEGSVWDVVKDGVCVTQMAGPNGARQAIDALLDTAK